MYSRSTVSSRETFLNVLITENLVASMTLCATETSTQIHHLKKKKKKKDSKLDWDGKRAGRWKFIGFTFSLRQWELYHRTLSYIKCCYQKYKKQYSTTFNSQLNEPSLN